MDCRRNLFPDGHLQKIASVPDFGGQYRAFVSGKSAAEAPAPENPPPATQVTRLVDSPLPRRRLAAAAEVAGDRQHHQREGGAAGQPVAGTQGERADTCRCDQCQAGQEQRLADGLITRPLTHSGDPGAGQTQALGGAQQPANHSSFEVGHGRKTHGVFRTAPLKTSTRARDLRAKPRTAQTRTTRQQRNPLWSRSLRGFPVSA